MRPDLVIKGSVLSEKAYGLLEKKIYTLKVALQASKEDIKAALKMVYNVDVLEVNTSITRGKVVRKARSRKGKSANTVKMPNMKKAYVRLKDGQEIASPSAMVTEAEAVKG